MHTDCCEVKNGCYSPVDINAMSGVPEEPIYPEFVVSDIFAYSTCTFDLSFVYNILPNLIYSVFVYMKSKLKVRHNTKRNLCISMWQVRYIREVSIFV